MAIDFLHSEAVMDAIIAEITANAPDDWFTDGKVENLQLCAVGSLQEYAIRDVTDGSRQPSVMDECPAILVRPLTVTPDIEYGGIGGEQGTDETYRIVMVRTFAQTLDDDGDKITVARGKSRYAKLLNKAIFTNGRLGSPTLTTDDTSADIIRVSFLSADLSDTTEDTRLVGILPAQIWAIAIDASVNISTVR